MASSLVQTGGICGSRTVRRSCASRPAESAEAKRSARGQQNKRRDKRQDKREDGWAKEGILFFSDKWSYHIPEKTVNTGPFRFPVLSRFSYILGCTEESPLREVRPRTCPFAGFFVALREAMRSSSSCASLACWIWRSMSRCASAEFRVRMAR